MMLKNKKPLVVCLMGPTASGKTDLAIKLVQAFPFEIISVDSAMVYRGLDIGAAKPTTEELALAPHHLIDIRDPLEPYSAADFRKDALKLIDDILSRGKMPLFVGGTMLYFRALQEGLSELPEANEKIRNEILQQAEKEGWEKLHEALKKVDPKSAIRIHPNDPQRLQRALEVYYLTGKPMSGFFENQNKSDFNFLNIGLIPEDRKWLHARIEKRFHMMLEQGFLEEAKALFNRGDLHEDLPAIRAVGYRQAWSYLKGEMSKETFIEKGIVATRQLAKRQLTWLRSWKDLHSFSSENAEEVYNKIVCLLKVKAL
jgi:tRNA dimethylallyltransferase